MPAILLWRNGDSKGTSPPPPYHRAVIGCPTPSYVTASALAKVHSGSGSNYRLAVPNRGEGRFALNLAVLIEIQDLSF